MTVEAVREPPLPGNGMLSGVDRPRADDDGQLGADGIISTLPAVPSAKRNAESAYFPFGKGATPAMSPMTS
jgi:hypothetical protein